MARLDQNPLVRVTWHDAYTLGNNEWRDLDDIKDEPCIVYSVGYWLKRKRSRHLVLIQSCADDEQVDNVLLIPMGMVKKVERLRIPHKPRKAR